MNAVMCHNCNAVVESRHVHDFQTCDCGDVSVDGGPDYARRVWQEGATWTELDEPEAVPSPSA